MILYTLCMIDIKDFVNHNGQSLSNLCNYFNIFIIPTTKGIHVYYYKLYLGNYNFLLLLIHNVIIKLIYY